MDELAAWVPNSGVDVLSISVQECLAPADFHDTLQEHMGAHFTVLYHGIGNSNTALGYHGYIAVFVAVANSLVEQNIALLSAAIKRDIALGRSLLVTRAANKGAAAIIIPLALPRTGVLVASGGPSPAIKRLAKPAPGSSSQRVISCLVFVSCHLASDSKGKSKLDKRNKDAQEMLQGLGLDPGALARQAFGGRMPSIAHTLAQSAASSPSPEQDALEGDADSKPALLRSPSASSTSSDDSDDLGALSTPQLHKSRRASSLSFSLGTADPMAPPRSRASRAARATRGPQPIARSSATGMVPYKPALTPTQRASSVFTAADLMDSPDSPPVKLPADVEQALHASLALALARGYVFMAGDLNYRTKCAPEQGIMMISKAASEALASDQGSVHRLAQVVAQPDATPLGTSLQFEKLADAAEDTLFVSALAHLESGRRASARRLPSASPITRVLSTAARAYSEQATGVWWHAGMWWAGHAACWGRVTALDELRAELRAGSTWAGFEEPPIAWPPSYRRTRARAHAAALVTGRYALLNAVSRAYTTHIGSRAGSILAGTEAALAIAAVAEEYASQDAGAHSDRASCSSKGTGGASRPASPGCSSAAGASDAEEELDTLPPMLPTQRTTSARLELHGDPGQPAGTAARSIARQQTEPMPTAGASTPVKMTRMKRLTMAAGRALRMKPAAGSDGPAGGADAVTTRPPSYTDRILVRRPLAQQSKAVRSAASHAQPSMFGAARPAIQSLPLDAGDGLATDVALDSPDAASAGQRSRATTASGGKTVSDHETAAAALAAAERTALPTLICNAYGTADHVQGSDHVPVCSAYTLCMGVHHTGVPPQCAVLPGTQACGFEAEAKPTSPASDGSQPVDVLAQVLRPSPPPPEPRRQAPAAPAITGPTSSYRPRLRTEPKPTEPGMADAGADFTDSGSETDTVSAASHGSDSDGSDDGLMIGHGLLSQQPGTLQWAIFQACTPQDHADTRWEQALATARAADTGLSRMEPRMALLFHTVAAACARAPPRAWGRPPTASWLLECPDHEDTTKSTSPLAGYISEAQSSPESHGGDGGVYMAELSLKGSAGHDALGLVEQQQPVSPCSSPLVASDDSS